MNESSAPPGPGDAPLHEAEQLHQAALQASQAGRSDEAITLWKQSLALVPHQPAAHYLLGAEHAHTRQYGEAVVHFSLAIEQAPHFPPVRLQLGLLWLTLGSAAQVEPVLSPLLALPATDAFHHFGAGLIHLAKDELEAAAQALSEGLSRELDNAPLRQDMTRLLDRIRQVQSDHAAAARPPLSGTSAAAVSASNTAAQTPDAVDEAQHGLVISAYLSSLKH